jgi:predicted exporter
VLTPTTLAPPARVVTARRAAWCAADYPANLAAVALPLGFRPEAFAAFRDDWRALCADGGQALGEPTAAVNEIDKVYGRATTTTLPSGAVRVALAFEADDAGLERARQAIAAIPNVSMLHRSELNARMVAVVAKDLPRLAAISLGLVFVLLVLSFRDLRHPIRALAPCLLALATTLGVLAVAGVPVNLMNLVVFPILAGVGIDYGVLMAYADRDPEEGTLQERAFSLTVAAVTTLADFGSFITAKYYALATIGHAVVLAVFCSALFALFISPALAALSRPRATNA